MGFLLHRHLGVKNTNAIFANIQLKKQIKRNSSFQNNKHQKPQYMLQFFSPRLSLFACDKPSRLLFLSSRLFFLKFLAILSLDPVTMHDVYRESCAVRAEGDKRCFLCAFGDAFNEEFTGEERPRRYDILS